MNILFVTLARHGSKSIPLKNIAPIAGVPLIQYTTQQVLKSKYFNNYNYIVSTDSIKIGDAVTGDNIFVDVDRPTELANDTAPSGVAVKYCCELMEKKFGLKYDIVVEVMATNPLKTAEDIDGCIEMLVESNYSSVVAVKRVFDEHPSRVKYLENGLLKSFYPEIPESRRQDLFPAAYIRAGSIYAVTRSLLSTGLRYDNEKTGAYVLEDHRVINIDEPADLDRARMRLELDK